MKNTQTRKLHNDDSTHTLQIITGETYEGTIVTEKLSIDEDSGDTIMHVTLESPTTEVQVLRTLEELAAEAEEESVEIPMLSLDEDAELIDEITFDDPASDALELALTEDD
jgi:hypothetical protein